ncbi:MAG: hypothetical protein QOF02_1322 [Blastocatellia bacterium]|jgi:hypothetical protein|nr:hypothetical protein [Blastocatellia bacterium]
MSTTLQQERATPDTAKLIVALIAGAYFLWAMLHPQDWRLIDGVNLVIHEAGHLFFRPFGEFMMIAGGSLFQLIVPATFAFYFYYQEKPYSCALVLLWAGESLLNVSVYAGDSVAMQLPLLGGNDSIHDWNYLLDHMGWLSRTNGIAKALHLAAASIVIAATLWAIISASRSQKKTYV